MSASHIQTELARSWCYTTCAQSSPSAGAIGRHGGSNIAIKYRLRCARSSSVWSCDCSWSSSSRAIEATRTQELGEGKQPLVAQLARLRAIGSKGAWVLVKEVFGWRHFANRRELASSLGLVPTPYASGDCDIEPGISKAGNRAARTLLVELAWGWLRLQ